MNGWMTVKVTVTARESLTEGEKKKKGKVLKRKIRPFFVWKNMS